MMEKFEKKLSFILKNQEKPRPFVCNGNPYHCKIFIAGFNAATEMEAEFWNFWSTSNGFDKEKWLETYISERAAKPLKSGKTRRNRISATRQRIELIVTSAAPINCLETNIYSKATPTKQELSNHEMDSSVFEFLFKEIKPEILFSHGVDARKHIELLSNSQVEEDNITEVTIFDTKTKILSMPHLSRGWSKEKTRSIGEYLKTLCSNIKT